MNKPVLSIIIVNYNTKELLRQCLKSLISNIKYQKLNMEIIVVDNGSTDGSQEYLKKLQNSKYPKLQNSKYPKLQNSRLQIPRLKVIFNRENLGFATACNQGIEKAEGNYILLLNSDTKVEKGQLEKLLKFAQSHPEAGIVGPKLALPSGEIQASCRNLPTIKRAILEYWLGKKGTYDFFVPDSSKPYEVETVTGAAMFIPRKVFEKIGAFDSRFFMYFEDLDFCRRARKAGYKIYYFPEAQIFHHHGASGREISEKTYQWLCKSSKIYHGAIRHFLINFIIWSGQKWQKLRGK